MEAKELRLGNYIEWSGNIHKVIAIDLQGVFIKKKNLQLRFIKTIKPIPLTEEWLLKFGFKRHGGDYYNDIIILKNVVCFDTGRVFDAFEIKIFPNELGSAQEVEGMLEISYVHQLQNLYFALTGKELIIK